jgi:Caspase domain
MLVRWPNRSLAGVLGRPARETVRTCGNRRNKGGRLDPSDALPAAGIAPSVSLLFLLESQCLARGSGAQSLGIGGGWQMGAKRAAVCIGVDSAGVGSMPVLTQAARGARAFADWARDQGCNVFLFVDETDPVLRREIRQNVEQIVAERAYGQLIVYFAGHGTLITPGAEVWLLSEAGSDNGEGVNVYQDTAFARLTGIPHVVFVSDACRTYASESQLSITGGNIFPRATRLAARTLIELDSYFAASPGMPAYEEINGADVDGHGIFTDCFLELVRTPPPEIIEHALIGAPPNEMSVITSRKIKLVLPGKVEERVQRRGITYDQLPEIRAESDLPQFIAMVQPAVVTAGAPSDDSPGPGGGQPSGHPPGVPPQPVGPIGTIYPADLPSNLAPRPTGRRRLPEPEPITREGVEQQLHANNGAKRLSRLQNHVRNALRLMLLNELESISEGAAVVAVAGTAMELVESSGYKRVAAYEYKKVEFAIMEAKAADERFPRSAVVRFADGRACLVSLVSRMATLLVVDTRGMVLSVQQTPMWPAHGEEYGEELFEVVRIYSALAYEHALRGDLGYMLKSSNSMLSANTDGTVDHSLLPELDTLRAYAMAETGLFAPHLFKQSFQETRVPFDLAMLVSGTREAPTWTGELGMETFDYRRIAPFGPQLTRGWLLLDSSDEFFAWYHEKLRSHIIPSLWTTFDNEGAELAIEAMLHGGAR